MKLRDGLRLSFVVQFPHVAIQKGRMTDERLLLFLAKHAAGSTWSPPVAAGKQEVRRVPLADEVLDSRAFQFLLNVAAHPDAGLKERYLPAGVER